MKIYSIFKIDGSCQELASETKLSLEMLQKIVGGYVEIHKLGKTFFIMDEEGNLKGKQNNPAFPAFVGDIITTQDGV